MNIKYLLKKFGRFVIFASCVNIIHLVPEDSALAQNVGSDEKFYEKVPSQTYTPLQVLKTNEDSGRVSVPVGLDTTLEDSGSSVGSWPASSIRETLAVFRSGQPGQGFSEREGIEAPSTIGLNRAQFAWRNLIPAWGSDWVCSKGKRSSGFIQTETFENIFGRDLRVRIVLPIRFELNTQWRKDLPIIFRAQVGRDLWPSLFRRNRLLGAELFRVSVLQLASDSQRFSPILVDEVPKSSTSSAAVPTLEVVGDPYSRAPVVVDEDSSAIASRFRVMDLCVLDRNCKDALANLGDDFSLSLKEPVFSRPFVIPSGANVRVRIEWSGAGICDEGESSFLLGDQVRVVEVI